MVFAIFVILILTTSVSAFISLAAITAPPLPSPNHSSPTTHLTSPHLGAPHCTLYSPRCRRAERFVLLTVIFIISTFLSPVCRLCVCACVCVRMSTITHAHASALLAKYTQLHLTVRMCVCVSVCESNNLNKYFVHCHLGYSVLFVVISLFLFF